LTLIDSHSHVNFNAFKDDADEVIRRSLSNEVWQINVGSQYQTSKRAVELAEKYSEGVYAAIGLHPIHVNTGFKTKADNEESGTAIEDFDIDKYRQLALSSKKVVAIGETGLDYYYKPKTRGRLEQFKTKQRGVFEKQMALAEELGLPIIFHCRFAHPDMINVLNYKLQATNYKLNGVVHCFTGTKEEAEDYLKMGLYLGINGIIFKLDLNEVIKDTPLEKMLIETDCPYLVPPMARAERNEPLFVKYVAERIAEIKKTSFQEVVEATTRNARELFKIG